MRSFQRLGAAFVLSCALTLPAFAGDMHTGSGVAESAGDSLTEAVLSLLEGVLALF